MTASAWSKPISTAASPPGSSSRGSCGRQRAIGVEAFLAGEQRLVRLILGDARTELGAVGDIGRIAQDQVEPLGDALRPSRRAEVRRAARSRGAAHCADA